MFLNQTMRHFQRSIKALFCLAIFLVAGPGFAAQDVQQNAVAEKFRHVVVGVVVAKPERTAQQDALVAKFIPELVGKDATNALPSRLPGTQRTASSGVLVSADGLVLTALSLFGREQSIEIHTESGAEYVGKLVLSDRISGLALVKIQSSLVWEHVHIEKPSQPVSLGERVLAFGVTSPGGVWKPVVTEGVVTELERTDVAEETNLKASVSMVGGFLAGGLLVRANSSEIIGINNFQWRWGRDVGITQASPIEQYLRVAADFRTHGRVLQPTIGLVMDRLGTEERQALYAFDKALKGGILVRGTTPNEPAHLAGLERGDIVVRLDAVDVLSITGFVRTLRDRRPGDEIVLSVLRKGALISIKVKTMESKSP
ncbi:MAG: S1C family serine protease [Pseudomonadota bacterium]